MWRFAWSPYAPGMRAPRFERCVAFPTLQGFRGAPPVDLGALEDILLRLSSLAEQRSELHEIDLNPVFAYPARALAVDARILLACGASMPWQL
jgi:acyl-CoA synthetase (NDP forming)